MATEDGFQPDRPPIFLSGHAEEAEQPDIGKGLGHSDDLVANSQDEYFGCSGDGDRHRDSIGRKSGCARCERDGLVGRQTGASAVRPIRRRQQFKQLPARRIRRRQRRMRRRATKLLRLWNLPSQARPRPPVRGRPRAVSARPRTASQSLPTTSRSLKNCSSNSRPGQPKKRRGNRPGPRKLRPYGWRKMARRRRGPRRSTDGFTPCKMHARRSVPSDIIAQGSGSNNKMHGDRSRP